MSNTEFFSLLVLLNSSGSCIRFTCKVESDSYFLFLDVFVNKHINRFSMTNLKNPSHLSQQKMHIFYTYFLS